jgi:hypothetical protein
MGHQISGQDRVSWQLGFDDALAGRQSPMGDKLAYRSGHIEGSALRMSRRTMMAVAFATLASIPPATAVTEPPDSDPILAAIEHHRRAWHALKIAPDHDDTRLHEAVLDAEAGVVNTLPTTPAGVLALRTYHRELRERGGLGQPVAPSRSWRPGKA